MRIIIFGATGGTGRALVEQGLNLGHAITAFVRNPDRLKVLGSNLAVTTGDARDAAAVASAIKGHDAVLSALGAWPGKGELICSPGTAKIIAGMKKHGVRRLIVESAFGAGDSRRSFYGRFLWVVIRKQMKDKEGMEQAVPVATEVS